MKNYIKHSTSVITAVLTVFFIDIIWHYNFDPCFRPDELALLVAIPILLVILIYCSHKLRKHFFEKKTQQVFVTISLFLIISSLAYLIYVIFGREQGPWTDRRTCSWGGPSGRDWVFDLPIGLSGVLIIYPLWILVNLNLSAPRYKTLQYIGLIIFPVIIILLYLGSKVPINFSLYQG